ncbi:unnamed protein product [Cunninghamella echinulata]
MDDNDFMLNIAPSKPKNIQASANTKINPTKTKGSTTENPNATTVTAAGSTTATATGSTTATTTKVKYGKAQILSSLFTSNPDIEVEKGSNSNTTSKKIYFQVMHLV